MGPIPEDLIVFLLFGAFVLVQILRRFRRDQARRAKVEPVAATPAEMQTQAEPEAEAAPAAERLTRSAWRMAPDVLEVAVERAAAPGIRHYIASGAETPSRQSPLQMT